MTTNDDEEKEGGSDGLAWLVDYCEAARASAAMANRQGEEMLRGLMDRHLARSGEPRRPSFSSGRSFAEESYSSSSSNSRPSTSDSSSSSSTAQTEKTTASSSTEVSHESLGLAKQIRIRQGLARHDGDLV